MSTDRWRSITLRLLAGIGLVLVMSPLSGCAQAARSAPLRFNFDQVQDATGSGLYRVGPTAAGTATDNDSSLSIVLTVVGTRRVTAHPNATVYFADTTVHCFANGASPHDPVSLHAGPTSVVLRCEEPFSSPTKLRGITVSDGGA